MQLPRIDLKIVAIYALQIRIAVYVPKFYPFKVYNWNVIFGEIWY